MEMPGEMTIPLWCLAGLVVLSLALLLALLAVRLRHLSSGGSVRDFGIPDERKLGWRLFRAHANAVENLPLFIALVVIASVRGVGGAALDVLSVLYFAARVGHSTVHVAGAPGNARLAFLLLQVACLLGILGLVVQPPLSGRDQSSNSRCNCRRSAPPLNRQVVGQPKGDCVEKTTDCIRGDSRCDDRSWTRTGAHCGRSNGIFGILRHDGGRPAISLLRIAARHPRIIRENVTTDGGVIRARSFVKRA